MGGDAAASRAGGGADQGQVHALGQAGKTEQLVLGEQAQVGDGAGARAASEDPATEAEAGGDGNRLRVGSIVFMTHDTHDGKVS